MNITTVAELRQAIVDANGDPITLLTTTIFFDTPIILDDIPVDLRCEEFGLCIFDGQSISSFFRSSSSFVRSTKMGKQHKQKLVEGPNPLQRFQGLSFTNIFFQNGFDFAGGGAFFVAPPTFGAPIEFRSCTFSNNQVRA